MSAKNAWCHCLLVCVLYVMLVASDGQRDEAKLYIERYVMSRIYTEIV